MRFPRLFFLDRFWAICGTSKPGGKEGLDGVAVEMVLPSVKETAELPEVE